MTEYSNVYCILDAKCKSHVICCINDCIISKLQKHRKRAALTVWKDGSHLQVASGQSYNGCFVQLAGDGWRKRKQFGQFVELGVFLLASRLGGVLRLVFHRRRRRRRQALQPVTSADDLLALPPQCQQSGP